MRRTGAGWTRLAARSARQPSAKVTRACTASSCPPRTATPIASTRTTRGGIHEGQELAVVAKGTRAATLGDGGGLGGVEVGDAHQLDAVEPGQDAGVLLAEVADADNRQSQPRHDAGPSRNNKIKIKSCQS